MSMLVKESVMVRELRNRYECDGGVFWVDNKEALAVFHPDLAKKINALNYADLTIPDKLTDVLRGRKGCPFSWSEIRAGWLSKIHEQSQADELGELFSRMIRLFDERLEKPLDLVVAAQEIITQSLVPTVIANLSAKDMKSILADHALKLAPLTIEDPTPGSFWNSLQSMFTQMKAASVVRRELGARSKGARPRQKDLTDSIVEMLPRLGIDRGVDAVTMALTAIAGPPGAAASCLLYELCLRPDWKEKLTKELTDISPQTLCQAPTKMAPITSRFVKEVLRMWSPPVIMTRFARTDIEVGEYKLKKGQQYLLSPYIIHHDSKYWSNPDTFDPDRWLPKANNGPRKGNNYIPFSWAPKACIGSVLGTFQLIILTYLVCTQYRVLLTNPSTVGITLAAMPLPLNFKGSIHKI